VRHWWDANSRLLNAWSNAAYALAGVGVGALFGTPAAWAFAATMLALAVGSGAYHSRRTRLTRKLDWLGMYAVIGGLAVYAASPWDVAIPLWMAAVGFGVAGALVFLLPGGVGANHVLGVGLVLVALPALWDGIVPALAAVVSLLMFVIAKVYSDADIRRDAWVGHGGHALWHCWTALAFVAMFLAQTLRGGV